MIKELEKKITQKIENEKMLVICRETEGSHNLQRVVPNRINIEHGIYIEGDDYILDISDKVAYDVSFDELEDEFMVRQGHDIYTFS